MRLFRTRTDLVMYARDHVNSRACQRAFTTGNVKVLGGFSPLSPSPLSGWLLQVTSQYGRVWFVAITVPEAIMCGYLVWFVDEVPWKDWVGQHLCSGSYNIRDGDDPIGSFIEKVRCQRDER